MYSLLQIQHARRTAQRMTTLERSLAQLVRDGKVARHEAERVANNLTAFEDEMKRVT